MSAPSPAPLGRRQLVLFTAVAIFFGLGLCLAFSEGVLRLLGRRPAYLDAEMYVPVKDGRGYGLRPGYRGLYAGGRVAIGPLGLRGAAPPRPRSVLLLGDSAGFGQGLDEDQTIAEELARLLAAAGRPLPVTNAAIPGYNTTAQLSQLKVLLPLLQPHQVVLLYVVDNDADLRPGVWVREDGSLDLHLNESLTGRLSRLLTRHLIVYAQLRGLFQIRQADLQKEDRTPFAKDDPGWLASQAALRQMRALLAAEGVPFAVGGIALVQNLEALPLVEALCQQERIPYKTLWQTRSVDEFVQHHAISRTDSHANAAATAKMAAALFSLLQGTP